MGITSLTLACVLLAGSPAQNSDLVPINKRNFKIPILVEPSKRAQIKLLKLYVSTDQGQTWNESSTRAPDQDHFTFYAQTDGLYWFTVAIVDQQDRQVPVDPYRVPPSQKILVDTTAPDIRIISAERDSEEIAVSWEIREEHPDLESLRLEYRPADAPNWALWYAVPITRELTGKTKFKLGSPAAVALRMEMKDQAGNAGTTTKDVAAATPTDRLTSSPSAPAPHMLVQSAPSTTPPPPPVLNVPNNNTAAVASSAAVDCRYAQPAPAGVNYPPVPSYPAAGGYPAATSSPPAGVYSPAPNYPPASGNPPAPNYPPTGGYPVAGNPPMPNYPPVGVNYPPGNGYSTGCFPPAANYPPATNNLPAANPAPAPDNATRVVAWSPNSDPGAAALAGSSGSAPRGPAANVIVVNDPQVSLEYEMKFGASGVSKVELWLTEDEGRTWRPYAEDEDKKSPITAKLPGQGLFGVRLVTTSGAGLSEGPPQPGDPPDIRIEVDTTPPHVQLFEPKADPQRPDTLVLSWTATDRNLAQKPVTLEYAEPRGAWQTIASNQPAVGSLNWQLPRPLSHVQLRVTAIDTAGNRSVAETREAFPCDLNKTKGRIIGIAPGKHGLNDFREARPSTNFSERPPVQQSPLGGNQ